jgi:hypothetical protein
MTLADRIREVLRAASEPMTAREVREALDDNDVTAANVSSPLFAMCETGEVLRGEATGSGSGTYMIDPAFVAKRASKQDQASEVMASIAKDIRDTAKATRREDAQATKKSGRPAGSKAKAKKRTTKVPAAKRAIAKRIPRDPRIGTALTISAGKFAGSVAAMLDGNSGAGVTVHVDRGTLRGLALAVMALHPGPMPDGLKSTVLTAVEATL